MKPQPHIEHTAEVGRRRRVLFPCEDNSQDSDLGCISPLNFDDESCANQKLFSLNDYDIIGLVVKGHSVQTPNNSAVVSKIFTPSTSDESPTQKLKTPHDLSDNTKFPKLIRSKTQIDTAINPDYKNPKVRTALFPEIDMSLPSRTFYPKNESEGAPRSVVATPNISPSKPKKKQSLFLCSRRTRYRSGQINAGVRHKIKKRKIKRISRIAALQAAISIIENSPLNPILDESREPSLPLTPPSPLRDPTPSPEPDPSKKFFKSSRHKGIVTVNSGIKLEMNNGRLTLLSKKNPLKRTRGQESSNSKRFKPATFENDQPLIAESAISNLIQTLEEEKENENRAQGAVLMSPTSQMCNMTSGLALNSPKKARDLSGVLEAMPGKKEEKKLFPVFYPGKTVASPKNEPAKISCAKKFKGLAKDQMLLDAGQKHWGITQCPECKIVYHMGDPGDEVMHLNYHNASHVFRFNGWKNERVVSGDFSTSKIVQIVPGDPKIWWKKVKEVMEVINRDLGFYDIEFNTTNSQIFFCINNKMIVGTLVAESKTSAHKLLTTHQDQVDLCSEESYSVKCGVSRIWVAQNHRKNGVATALMECLKRNFMFGYILKNEDVAFSSPTEMGKIFGAKYFKTPNFLIYFV